MEHKLRREDFLGYLMKHEIAASFGRGENKRLIVCVDISKNTLSYQVLISAIVVYSGKNFNKAIKTYNQK